MWLEEEIHIKIVLNILAIFLKDKEYIKVHIPLMVDTARY